MFDRNFRIRSEFISDPKTLKKRLMIVGFVMLLLSPFLVIFMLVYLFLRHAEQFYNHPSSASSRRWSNLSKWMFREFNEVDHFFKHRINNSVVHASEYLKQFPSPKISIVAKFISFVSGGFAAVLIIIAFLDESLLEGHIFGRNLFWYAAVFGTITAISRAAVTDELPVLDPQGVMSIVVQRTHYMPKRWRGKENTNAVRIEFETLFQYTGMMLLEEMASIFLTPFLLLFVVPKRVDDILQFIADFTVDVEGVGHVCSFSVFDFQNHGNCRYGSRFNSPRHQRSAQGKMEKSFLSFRSNYPSWEPNGDGKLFLVTLEKFREQKLQPQALSPAYFTSRPSRHQVFSDRNSFLSREVPFSNVRTGNRLSTVWPMEGEQKDYPFILDWYYTSQPQNTANVSGNLPSRGTNIVDERDSDLWMSSHLTQNAATYDENWRQNAATYDENWRQNAATYDENWRQKAATYDENWRQDEATYDESWGPFLEERAQGQLEASTSAPFFQESVLQQNDFNNGGNRTTSHWWARNKQQGANLQTSFLEPPSFNRQTSTYNDNLSDSSTGEKEHLDWTNYNRLSRTFLMGDDGGEFNLPFDDIYRRSSESPKENWDPSDIV